MPIVTYSNRVNETQPTFHDLYPILSRLTSMTDGRKREEEEDNSKRFGGGIFREVKG